MYTSSTSWTVPAGVSSITIKVYGGGGGTGGQDCGAGCSNAAAGPAGYVEAMYNVVAGDVIGIYPGGQGANGANSVTGTGGGAGGTDTYPSGNYNGGTGGNAGGSGSSGGGGGGGAASLVTINSTISIVAGGAGGGGGMANMANSGLAGTSTASSNGTNAGGNGTTPGGDGGGGAGSGGGQFASVGAGVHAAGGESAGDGGFIGANAVSGANLVITNGNIAWANAGRIEITFVSTLPVTWLSFTAARQNKAVVLKWSTTAELNAKDFIIQRSTNSTDWTDIGTVNATGSFTTVQQYNFTDQAPLPGLNYYRLQQRDIDGAMKYSKVIAMDMTGMVSLFRLYPNPVVNGTTTISLAEPATATVYGVNGVKLLEKQFPKGTHPLHLSALSAGTYYLRIKDEVIPFVVQ